MIESMDEGRLLVSGPSPRCFPHTDGEFQREIAAAIALHGSHVDLVLAALRERYPELRIVEREAWASLDGGAEPVWYCYRDGHPVPGGDGVGAMRLWTRIEAVTNQSLDLLQWSSEVMDRARRTLMAAESAVAAHRRWRDARE